VSYHDYVPFGAEILAGLGGRSGLYGSADGVNKKFTGQYRDTETQSSAMASGLDYFGARYFSAAMGRWTSPDWSATPQPIPYADLSDPQTLNLYSYVRNNPLSKADADGHETDEEKARRAAQGAAASVGTQATQDAAARAAYHQGLQPLQGAPKGDPVASAARTALKIDARAASSPTGAAIAEVMRPIANEAARVGGTASKSNPAVDAAMGVAGKAGPALMVVGVGVSAYNVATSDNPSRALAQEGGAWAGALALGGAGGSLGAQAGAAVGVWFGGVGAVPGAAIGGAVGAIGGGIAGAIGGEKLATKVYDWLH
jgi:RHS repeat-associated protein